MWLKTKYIWVNPDRIKAATLTEIAAFVICMYVIKRFIVIV